jgi:3-oxoacyl-[acyl-carrier protein] reductase
MHLKEKNIVITGASRGIGKAIALKLASEGANIAFTYNSSEKEADSLLKELLSHGCKAKSFKVDVRDLEKIILIKNEIVESFGSIDVLINNAGIIKDSALLTMNPNDWKDVIDVNLTGVFNFSKAFIVTFMKQGKGHILNITSLSGIIGLPKQTNYSASKGGVIAFTKALAKEVAPLNVRVNAIAPGFIETDMVKDLNSKLREKVLDQIPLKRFGTPEEVAELVSLLLNEKMSYITGQVIQIDGGLGI